MKTTIDRLAHKYALNIKQIRGPGPTKIADFKNLNKNFYDDIESNNITIKDDTKLLNKIKNHSIKEFIYTNKEIPDQWKNKINYQDEILHVISKDKKLLSYIGSSTIKPIKNSMDKFPKINTRYDASKSLKSRNIEKNDSRKDLTSINDINDIKNNNNINSSMLSISTSRGMKNKYNFNQQNQLNEKEINALMDDYKTAYPIKEKLRELYITSNYYNSNKNKNQTIFQELYENDENKLNNTKKTYNSIDTTHRKMPRHVFVHTNKKLINKKQKTFRQNIFNNLSPGVDNNTIFSINKDILNKLNKINKSNKIININKENKFIDINKINDINNPIIKKNIEGINFYGPYFSFCPSCRNRNMDFYNNLEQSQCLELIQFIKKVRHKNPIMSIRKTCSVSPIKKSYNKKDTLESEDKDEYTENDKVGSLV